jgi:N-methylhydantoinase B/oxoprolinase/acetone carboxylase alpha subunit
MTNSLNTPVEALEALLPVTVERFTIRRGSGGTPGAWRNPRGSRTPAESAGFRGGDGIERMLRFHVPVDLSLITERRDAGPWGLAGGNAGAPGRNALVRAGTKRERPLPAKGTFRVEAGDALVVRTPGGGGYGRRGGRG